MFKLLRTLAAGASTRAEARVESVFALDLIDQKITQATAALNQAKATLASLIQRQRAERRMADGLQTQIADLTNRAGQALSQGDNASAEQAAAAIADLENELTLRQETLDRLAKKISRLEASVQAGHRRLVSLRQGAVSARAMRSERQAQARLGKTFSGTDSASEAEALIARVMDEDDPFEAGQILSEINEDLSHKGLADRMADKGYGPATRSTASAVLNRLKARSAQS